MREVREISCFELTNKYATARENMKVWIEIIRSRSLEIVKVDLRLTTGNPRDNLKRWVDCRIWAYLPTHNKDTAIR